MSNCGCAAEQQIIRGSLGEQDFLWPMRLTELTGQNITTDTVTAAVGSGNSPGSFVPVTTPHILTTGTILASDFKLANPLIPLPEDTLPTTTLYWVEAELFIGAAGFTGLISGTDYYPWLDLVDSPATVLRRGARFTYL